MRFPILALVLLLAVSHVALISHVTAHFEPAWEECELCVSKAQPLAAIPQADHGIPMDSEFSHHRCGAPSERVASHSCHSYHQRAPPLQSF